MSENIEGMVPRSRQEKYLKYIAENMGALDTPIPITQGGTGATNSANARTNLSVYAKSETYTQSEINTLLSGKANTNSLARVATSGSYSDLSNTPTQLTDFTGTLPITQGGTNATTVATARTNLDVYSKSEVDNAISTIDAKIPEATTSAIDIYVSTTGDDTTGDGTQGNPYQSLYHALRILPKIINHTVKIYVASGTYTLLGNYIENFSGSGSLTITKVSGDSNPLFSSVRAFLIQNNEIPIYLEYIDCVTGYSCFIDNPNGFVDIFGSSFAINDAQYSNITAALEVYSGTVDIAQTTVSNTNSGKYAMNVFGSRAKVFLRGNNTITANNTSSLTVWNGALVVSGNSTNTFSLEKTSGGQIIYETVSENRTALDVYSKSEVDSAIATAINNITNGDGVSY